LYVRYVGSVPPCYSDLVYASIKGYNIDVEVHIKIHVTPIKKFSDIVARLLQ
jgi:hypothetical protein